MQLELDRGEDSVNLSGDYDAVGVEIWTVVMEQAYAQYRDRVANGGDGDGDGYEEIEVGSSIPNHSHLVWELLTGENGTNTKTEAMENAELQNLIQDAWDDGKRVILNTENGAPDIIGDHAYPIVRRNTADTGWVLYNPQGPHDPTDPEPVILDSQLAANVRSVYILDP